MDLSRYAELFLTESREHLSALNHALLELERTDDSTEAVGAIFRGVHTIKGMSATMGYTAVAELAHELESLLDRVRRGERVVSPEIMDLLFESADALEQAIELSVGGRQAGIDLGPLNGRLRALAGAIPTAPAPHGAGWSAPAPEGAGILVRIRLAADTPLRGVRAFLIVQRARTLGEVTAVSPDVEALQAERFGEDFAFRIVTAAAAAAIESALRSTGDVADVRVGGEEHPSEAVAPAAGVPTPTSLAVIAGGAGAQGGASGWARRPPDGHGGQGQRHVRIDLRRLDTLMNLIGELVITRGRLSQLATTIGHPTLDDTVTQASRLISELQDQIMTSRMVPVWQVFDRFPRLVRDAARALGKQIDFAIEGKEIELDRSMLDEIGDPVMHLLRNAIDHGIESPAARVAAGKRPTGRLTLSTQRDRSSVLIRVSDDGRGIDRQRVLRRAQDLGLLDAGRTDMTDEELFRLIGRPGFSTAEAVTDISGRGVGVDAVHTRVRALGGSVEIRTQAGIGTSVTVRLPLTLAIVRALLARVGSETYALPMTHVNGTVQLDQGALRSMRGRDVLLMRDQVLPLVRLGQLVSAPPPATATAQQVVVLEVADRRAGLVVDELTGQQEVVIKQFDTARDALPLFSGATILGDGAPALIVDVNSLL